MLGPIVLKDYVILLFPKDWLKITSVEKDVSKQNSSGKEPTHPSAIDSLTFHLALIMMVSGASYGVLSIFKKYNILLLNSIPE